MLPIAGVTQDTGSGKCGNPFTLASQQSCVLSLTVNGNQLRNAIIGGPKICKTIPSGGMPDLYSCSQPNPGHGLIVTAAAPLPLPAQEAQEAQDQTATINITAGSPQNLITQGNQDSMVTAAALLPLPLPLLAQQAQDQTATIDITAGSPLNLITQGNRGLISIQNTSTVHRALNITANLANTQLANKVIIDASGCTNLAPLATCNLIVTPLQSVKSTAFTIQGTNAQPIIGQISVDASLAYIANHINSNITVCSIDSHSGQFNDCQDTGGTGFQGPESIVFHKNWAYVTSSESSSGDFIYLCHTNNQSGLLENCNPTGNGFNESNDITINNSGAFAYITNQGSDSISRCQIDNDSGELTHCTLTANGFEFAAPTSIALNHANTKAYITNKQNSSITKCSVNHEGGLTNCLTAAQGLGDPSKIRLNNDATYAYVTSNDFTKSVKVCGINAEGEINACRSTAIGLFAGWGNTALNTTNTSAYVPDINASTIALCNINAITGLLYNCINSGALHIDYPAGISLR